MDSADTGDARVTYPALFETADIASSRFQRLYFDTIRLEYTLLFLAAITSVLPFEGQFLHITRAIVFMGLVAAMIFRTTRRPEQDWYRCRALAESVKTSTWRYMMRAEPYDSDDAGSRLAFATLLRRILEANRYNGMGLWSAEVSGEQITERMEAIRHEPFETRKRIYLRGRIAEQRDWYLSKSAGNRRASHLWGLFGVSVYGIALVIVIVQANIGVRIDWPIDPLLVLAASIIGWMQIKKFNELTSAYSLTAHEIALCEADVRAATSDSELSAAVNEAERAFSREHTQWIARKDM